MTYENITIRKFLHGTFCPKEWKKTGKKHEQVFNYPDNPMKLIGNYVKLIDPDKLKELEQEQER